MVFEFMGGFVYRSSHKVQPEGAFREPQLPRGSYISHQVHLKVRLVKYKWRVDNDSSIYFQ